MPLKAIIEIAGDIEPADAELIINEICQRYKPYIKKLSIITDDWNDLFKIFKAKIGETK